MFLRKILMVLLCVPMPLSGSYFKKICVYIASSLQQQKKCVQFLQKAQKARFVKKETKLFLPDNYHMSLIYVTVPESNFSDVRAEHASQVIQEVCQKNMPKQGFTFVPKKLVYWGRLLALVYESPEFSQFHTKISKIVKQKFPELSIEHKGGHQPHITLGSITTKKHNAWRQGEHEFEIYENLPCVVKKDVPLMVMCK